MIGNRLFKANCIARRFIKRNPRHNFGMIARYRKTRVPCSCSMCQNPRRLFKNGRAGKTFQEIKQDVTYKEELNEI